MTENIYHEYLSEEEVEILKNSKRESHTSTSLPLKKYAEFLAKALELDVLKKESEAKGENGWKHYIPLLNSAKTMSQEEFEEEYTIYKENNNEQ